MTVENGAEENRPAPVQTRTGRSQTAQTIDPFSVIPNTFAWFPARTTNQI